MDPINLIIAVAVIGARLLVPLLIPRFPLPAIIACLLIDGVDQTVFQKYTTINLDNYQSYDKALDIYYLSIAYLSTFRNWTNQAAFHISQFLFYYRMVGATLFEITQVRAVLFIFPNTFEYFFIFYSAVALFWNTKRMTTRFLIGAAAFIWIFIKLPQEYWIHIAQLDTTDFIKETILGVPASSTWSYAISQNVWVIPALGIAALIIGVMIWQIIKRLPKPDHKLMITPEVNKLTANKNINIPKSITSMLSKYKHELIEKIILVGLVGLIFSQMFPTLKGSAPQVVLGIVIVILVNALFGYMIMHSQRFNNSLLNRFIPMYIFNLFAAYIYAEIASPSGQTVGLALVAFFAYIITLLTVLYDRFRPYYLVRFSK